MGRITVRPRECLPGCVGNSTHPGDEYSSSLSSAQCKRLEGGLDKLKEATIQLDELNQKLAVQKVVLVEKSAACEALLEEIVTNTAIGECGASSGTGAPQTGQGSTGGHPQEAICQPALYLPSGTNIPVSGALHALPAGSRPR